MPVSNYVFELILEETGSERLLVEGDLIRLCWDSGVYRFHDLDHLDFTSSVSFDIMGPHRIKTREEGAVEDALILVNGNDSQRST